MKTYLFLPIALLMASPALAQMQRDPGAALANADTNGDGVTTREEFRQSRVARFDKADRNHDGAVSHDDFKRLARFRPDAVERLDALIAEADADHDGRLTRDELARAPMPIFDRADADHDGRVTQIELTAFKAKVAALRDRR
ncbi:EF-hand domain-containing protein [Sphingomonas sp. RS6]